MKWCFLFLLSVLPVLANDSTINAGGTGPEPLGNYEGDESVIRMVSESIDIKFGKETSEVICRFTFRSTKKGAPARQTVGFPDMHSTDEIDVGHIREMHTKVDGQTVQAEKKRGWAYHVNGVLRATLGEKPPTKDSDSQPLPMDYFIVNVEFPEDRDVIIERHYISDNGSSFAGDKSFLYTTETGGVWKGTIGQADFHVTLDGWTVDDLAFEDGIQRLEPRKQYPWCSPNKSEWTVVSPTELKLTWKNFEPAAHSSRKGISLATWRQQTLPDETLEN